MLPTSIISAALALPALQGAKHALLAELGIPPAALQRLDLRARFDTSNAQRALAGSGIEVPPLSSYAARVWDHWERELDPERDGGQLLDEAVRGRVVLITGGSSGIGRAVADRLAAAGATVLLVARDAERLERARREIAAAGGSAIAYEADLSRPESIERLVEQLIADHARIDFIINNAGRSIRRSLIQSRERPHDFERTMALNYFGAIRLVMGLLPRLIDQGGAHVVNVSSIGVQTNPPRFSAYVASKAALDAWTRTVASELVGERITFTTVHMPLVRTPMIAPTRLYESFPTASPEEAAELICRAIALRPKHIGTRLGTLGEIAYALAPKAVDQILHTAYRVFPDSGAVGLGEPGRAPGERTAGDGAPADAAASPEALALAHLLRGVHW